MSTIPTFRTRRLLLRAVQLSDAEAYSRHFVDYDVINTLSAEVPWPYPSNGVEWFLSSVVLPAQGNNRWVWGIFLLSQPDELIGCVDLWRVPKPENRGFWLGKKFWGRGVMTEAVEPITDYAFSELGFDVLYFSNAVGNVASRRVKEKSGAKLIEIRPGSFVNPAYTLQELWVLTKDEWRNRKKACPPEDTDRQAR